MSKTTLEIVALDGGALPGTTAGSAPGAVAAQRSAGPRKSAVDKATSGPQAAQNWKTVAKHFGFEKLHGDFEKLNKWVKDLPNVVGFVRGHFGGPTAAASTAWPTRPTTPSKPQLQPRSTSQSSTTVVPPTAPAGPTAAAAESGAAEGASATGMLAILGRFAGPLAIAFIAVDLAGKAVVGTIKAVAGVFNKLSGEAERLQGYSAALSLAEAEKQIRREMSDMNRAQQAGPALAELERNRARIEQFIAGIMTKIYDLLARVANFILGPIADLLTPAWNGFADPMMGALLGIGVGTNGQPRKPFVIAPFAPKPTPAI